MIGYSDSDVDVLKEISYEEILKEQSSWEFKTFSEDGPKRVALASCNSLKRAPESKPNTFMWNDLSDTIDRKTDDFADLLIMAGDQVYADDWALNLGSLDYTKNDYENQKIPYPDLLKLYRKRYVNVWGNEDLQEVLSSIPSMMMWDDHDIYNGYGSHDKEYSEAFLAAEQSFNTFQGDINPDPNFGFDTETSKAFSFLTNNVGVIVIDGRFKRNFADGTIIGDEQFNQLENVLEYFCSGETVIPEHLFIVVGVPFLYLRNILGEGMELVGKLEASDIESDVNDGWRWGDNIEEFKRVMNLLFDYQDMNKKPKISVLSGDIHLSMKAYLEQKRKDGTVKIPQITSSPIGYHPPSELKGTALEATLHHNQRTQLTENIFGKYELLGTNSPFFLNDQWTLARRNYCLIDVERPHNQSLQFYYRAEGDGKVFSEEKNDESDEREKTDFSNDPTETREINRLRKRNIGRLRESL